MQLNRRTDYALRTLLYLAMIEQGRLATLDEISEKFHIARDHLIKIVNKLARLKYIITQRGKGGGIKFKPETLEVSIYEIVSHFEPTFELIDCNHLLCPVRGMCHLKAILDEASTTFIITLKKYKFKDVLPKTKAEQKQVRQKLTIPIVVE